MGCAQQAEGQQSHEAGLGNRYRIGNQASHDTKSDMYTLGIVRSCWVVGCSLLTYAQAMCEIYLAEAFDTFKVVDDSGAEVAGTLEQFMSPERIAHFPRTLREAVKGCVRYNQPDQLDAAAAVHLLGCGWMPCAPFDAAFCYPYDTVVVAAGHERVRFVGRHHLRKDCGWRWVIEIVKWPTKPCALAAGVQAFTPEPQFELHISPEGEVSFEPNLRSARLPGTDRGEWFVTNTGARYATDVLSDSLAAAEARTFHLTQDALRLAYIGSCSLYLHEGDRMEFELEPAPPGTSNRSLWMTLKPATLDRHTSYHLQRQCLFSNISAESVLPAVSMFGEGLEVKMVELRDIVPPPGCAPVGS
jgi:hypothetical protein